MSFNAPFLLSLSIGILIASMMMPHHTAANQAFEQTMTSMHTQMQNVKMTGNPDTDFAAMMIPHHQGAIEMAKIELQYGTDPRLRRLAQEIIVTQQSEIELMQLALKRPQSPSQK
ncbi:CopM family metallochaperone [Fischerella sp. JS2]|uniref:CopM family metallochaperone n=1 Tax=Fischerella sp. JS2 TaxID=2597771 RepID=UPI0028E74F0E|nr:DUF305 domain-containing protein [Fischerella sp. JS2]